MPNDDISPPNSRDRGSLATAALKQLFSEAGWEVREPSGPRSVDLIVRRRGATYAVEVKRASEGRSDRLIPLWSQAFLQAARTANEDHLPLAVVSAPRISLNAAQRVLDFAREHAPDAAAGVIDSTGLRLFHGLYLEELNSEPATTAAPPLAHRESRDLFSDLNQWMLKVLLAPEIPEHLLSAPRGRYRNATQLARAADVSVMSAFRFLDQLHRDGYLHESRKYATLVRRDDLLRRWTHAAARRVKEVPMRFVLRGTSDTALRRMLRSGRACLALFAAAKTLGLGFVEGVPPHVYLQRLDPVNLRAWKMLIAPQPGEPPDVFLRQPAAVKSVFRGIVRIDGTPVADVLQVWLDVSSHVARGKEQADLIYREVISKLIKNPMDHE